MLNLAARVQAVCSASTCTHCSVPGRVSGVHESIQGANSNETKLKEIFLDDSIGEHKLSLRLHGVG